MFPRRGLTLGYIGQGRGRPRRILAGGSVYPIHYVWAGNI